MKRVLLFFLFGILLLSACQGLNPVKTRTITPALERRATDTPPSPTATETPIQSLTICTADLPDSLFLYDGPQTAVKKNILALIAEPPYEAEGGELVPVILEKVPSQADGDLRLELVSVEGGQLVVDAAGEVAVLKPGLAIRPGGCQSADCVITWDGETTLEMDQMVLEFRLLGGLTWSDGAPVRSADSVFSFTIANDDDAPGLHWAEDRTQSYLALDDVTTQWKGLPGFTTAALDQFFWIPLPAHLFSIPVAWTDLISDERVMTKPLSYGPFVLGEVTPQSLLFVPNPTYYREAEGLPSLDEVIFKVVEGGLEEAVSLLQSGDCDVLESSFNWVENLNLLDQIRSDARFLMKGESGASWTQLVFGVDSAPNLAIGEDDRLALLSDGRTRQAIFACLDREAMLTKTMGDIGEVWPSFLPPELSKLTPDERLVHSPQKGIELLTSVGWVDHDGDSATPLQAEGVINVPLGTTLSLELLSSPSALQQDLVKAIQDDLAACGIEVTHTTLPLETLYAPGPEGPLFGRRFDLALIAWQPLPQDDCHLYDSQQVPSAENYWIGTNIAGLSDRGYDDACRTANLALPEDFDEAIHQAEKKFLDVLPAVPLFSMPRVLVMTADGCENGEISTESEFFRQLGEYQLGPDCR